MSLTETINYLHEKINSTCKAPCGATFDDKGNVHHFITKSGNDKVETDFNIRDIDLNIAHADILGIVVFCAGKLNCMGTNKRI